MGVCNPCKQGKCPEYSGCYYHTLDTVSDAVTLADRAIVQATSMDVSRAFWGYPTNRLDPGLFIELSELRSAARNHVRHLVLGGGTCLCPDDLQSVLERIHNIAFVACGITKPLSAVESDESGVPAFALRNAGCVPYDRWEAAFYQVCPVVPTSAVTVSGYQLSDRDVRAVYELFIHQMEPVRCLAYDISVTKRPDLCEFSYKLSAVARSCAEPTMRVAASVTEKRCKVEFGVLLEKINCNFDFSTFVRLRRCGISLDLLSEMTSCGYIIDYDTELACPVANYDGYSVPMVCGVDFSPLVNIVSNPEKKPTR